MSAAIFRNFGLRSRCCPEELDAKPLIDPDRHQIDAHRLIMLLRRQRATGRMLAFTNADLFLSVFSWVFGAAEMNGRGAVVSTRRLCPTFVGLPASEETLRRRVRSEGVHEVGHLLGLAHCPDRNCPMSFSAAAEEIDLKGDRLCDACRMKLVAPHR